jgi:hypothetical protein
MRRSELKSLIKECVVEVLLEGIGNPGVHLTESATPTRRKSKKNQRDRQPHPTDNVTYSQPEITVDTGLSQNPVMQSIFQDTAATTLQEQVASERRGPPLVTQGADRAALLVAEHEPDEMFEGAANWEKLAFGA